MNLLEKIKLSLAQQKELVPVTNLKILGDKIIIVDKKKTPIISEKFSLVDVKTEVFVSHEGKYIVSKILDNLEEKFGLYSLIGKSKVIINGMESFNGETIEKITEVGATYSIKTVLFMMDDSRNLYNLNLTRKSCEKLEKFLTKNGPSKMFSLETFHIFKKYYGVDFKETEGNIDKEIIEDSRKKIGDYIKNHNSKFVDEIEKIDLGGEAE